MKHMGIPVVVYYYGPHVMPVSKNGDPGYNYDPSALGPVKNCPDLQVINAA